MPRSTGLTDPPGRVRGKSETLLRVELLHRPDEPEVALLDQVEQRQPAIQVTARNLHHEAQIAFDHLVARQRVALLNLARQRLLLIGVQQLGAADLRKIHLGRVAEAALRRRYAMAGRRVVRHGVQKSPFTGTGWRVRFGLCFGVHVDYLPYTLGLHESS